MWSYRLPVSLTLTFSALRLGSRLGKGGKSDDGDIKVKKTMFEAESCDGTLGVQGQYWFWYSYNRI